MHLADGLLRDRRVVDVPRDICTTAQKITYRCRIRISKPMGVFSKCKGRTVSRLTGLGSTESAIEFFFPTLRHQ
jgi:hypothetical protein